MSNLNPTPPPGDRPDADAFFRARITPLPQVPSGRTALDIDAFETAYGKNTGYTREELGESVKRVRAEVRKARGNSPEDDVSPTQDPRTWERWIRGVGFGIYVLAALGLVFYAASIKGLGWHWTELQPYVGGIIVVGLVLLILSYGWQELKNTRLPDKTKKLFATIILGLFLMVAAAAVVWVVFVILQMLGIVSKPTPDHVVRPSSLGWYSGLAPANYRFKPEFSGIPFEIDKAQKMPAYLSEKDFQEVRERQKKNNEGETPPFYYLFATRSLQEYELLPRRIGFRENMNIQAELVVYVQEFVDGWTSYPSQGTIMSAKQFTDLPDRSKERRRHVVVLVVFPFDLSSFRRKLDEHHWNADGLLAVQFDQ